MRFAYADPPYHGMGRKMYGPLHPEAHIWDDQKTHLDLIARLCDDYPDGWALSCNPRDLSWLLPAVPDDARVAAWCKTWHQIRPTTTQYAWEPVIFRTERKDHKRSPMVRDWMASPVARGTGLQGAKPQVFNQWVLDLLAYRADEDSLDDLFPGSGGMAFTIAAPPLSLGATA